ncbi:MAG: 4'-phosphopantetheinyl transferase superfamily protein [Verrucomicrobiales bacterium]|nr:4'-phosphopantetheinyl transferase superfamily protein [Verrucomicrobiales bacterium]
MIEVVRAELSAMPQPDAELTALLSPEERERAARFHFERDRLRFVRRRAFRRIWIGARLGMNPAALRFGSGSHGKPSVAGLPPGVQFNCSSSADVALLAWSTEGPVGVDVEWHRPLDSDLVLVAERFAPSERRAIREATGATRSQLFFDVWARKEAFVKAVGVGLSLELDTFDVPLDHQVQSAEVRWTGPPLSHGTWRVSALEVGPEYSAAVVTDHPFDAKWVPANQS